MAKQAVINLGNITSSSFRIGPLWKIIACSLVAHAAWSPLRPFISTQPSLSAARALSRSPAEVLQYTLDALRAHSDKVIEVRKTPLRRAQ
jgi:hypothetical protein